MPKSTRNTKPYAAVQIWDIDMHFFKAIVHSAGNKLALASVKIEAMKIETGTT